MIQVAKIEALEWKDRFSTSAHLISFSEIKDPNQERIDFALLAVKNDIPIGYMTCRELDGESVYIQYGGTFPGCKNTIYSYKVLNEFMEFFSKKYNNIGMYIENTNLVMLKMAMKVGFLITGIRNFKGSILLEHQWQPKQNFQTC